MLKNFKGFLGPIGDDLPSLIPIIFGLTIFFASFTFSLNKFNEVNSLIDEKLEILKVSRGLRLNGYVSSHENFQELCESIQGTSIKFKAGLVDFSSLRKDSAQSVIRSRDFSFIQNEDKTNRFICLKEGLLEEEEIPDTARISNLVYPIALERNSVVVPVHLVVVAWK
ncbi:MAG TPA: hypothetical protein VJK05_03750 [archaeon]|nr:hypothetical protein [archaeon]